MEVSILKEVPSASRFYDQRIFQFGETFLKEILELCDQACKTNLLKNLQRQDKADNKTKEKAIWLISRGLTNRFTDYIFSNWDNIE